MIAKMGLVLLFGVPYSDSTWDVLMIAKMGLVVLFGVPYSGSTWDVVMMVVAVVLCVWKSHHC